MTPVAMAGLGSAGDRSLEHSPAVSEVAAPGQVPPKLSEELVVEHRAGHAALIHLPAEVNRGSDVAAERARGVQRLGENAAKPSTGGPMVPRVREEFRSSWGCGRRCFASRGAPQKGVPFSFRRRSAQRVIPKHLAVGRVTSARLRDGLMASPVNEAEPLRREGSALDLSCYTLEPLQSDQLYVLYRGVRAGDAPPGRASVLVREPVSGRGVPEILAYLQHAYALRNDLEPSWATRPLALVQHGGRTSLVLEDPGGLPLARLFGRDHGLAHDLGLFLRVATGIACAVGRMHARGVIHKDLKPTNVLVDRVTSRVWLTGFDIASRRPRERAAAQPPQIITGTPSYMAPEQTGLMDRSIDPRTDLYSLGVTLYELLTGTLPFTAGDVVEWMHSHVAQPPVPPADRLPGVESVRGAVSGIITRLLAKAPEDRYYTAHGIQRDLERCMVQWEAQRRIDEFPLGEDDAPDQLVITQQLYGRERDIETLLASCERVATDGIPELLLVSGFTGIGKSSLVAELLKMLVARRVAVASGKFDQSRRGVPYVPIAQAFRALIAGQLGRSEAELAVFRDRLRDALGPNAQIVVDLVPELELVVGRQPPVAALPPRDHKARVHLVLRRFISVFANPKRPLVLFLDDVQWADAATLDALEDLLTDSEVRHLVVIAAYRDGEVDATHPFTAKLQAVQKTGAAVRSVKLAPLSHDDLTRLVADTLHTDLLRVADLSRLIHQKTGGNPFFAVQLLRAIEEEGLLRFDHEKGRWTWDLSRILTKGHTDNLVDLLVERFYRLPAETVSALQQMACVGNAAARSMLSIVLDRREEQVDAALSPAVHLGLLDLQEADGKVSYRFVHDRVQEAAYSLSSERERAAAHLRIGTLLEAHTLAEDREATVFEIVAQLNRGAALITEPAERERLAENNLLAATRAKASSAYASALEYVKAGIRLLPADAWDRRHELAFELELLCAECESLIGAHATAAGRLSELSSRAVTTIERAAVVGHRTDIYYALDQADKAVDVALEYLQHIGIHWPRHPTEDDARHEYMITWSRLRERPIEHLLELPLMTDPASLATMNVLATVGQAMFFTEPNLYVLAECLAVRLSLDCGNTDASCDAYLRLGLITAQRFGEYGAGFRLGKVGFDLVERRGLKRFLASTYTGFASGLMPFGAHAGVVRDAIPRVYDRIANEFGDRLQAVWYGPQVVDKLLAAGNNLEEVQREAVEALKAQTNSSVSIGSEIVIATSQLAFVRTLRGLTDVFGSLDSHDFDERRLERQVSENPSLVFAAGWYWVLKLMARFFAGDYMAALEATSEATQAQRMSVPMLFYAADHHLFGALAHAAAFGPATSDARRHHILEMHRHHRQLQAWAENCPENFENRAALVAAEIARIEGHELDAQRLYEQAIRAACDNGFVHLEALAWEVAARFYAAKGFDRIAQTYLGEAREAYSRWGAAGKVRQLDGTYPDLRQDQPSRDPRSTIGAAVDHLDLATVLRVSQAVSGELVLERLIEALLRSAIEHAGAERGLLVVQQGTEFRIEAEGMTSGGAVAIRLRGPWTMDLPERIVRYAARTQEPIILDDASALANVDDDYVQRHHARSILCLPLVKQGKFVALLYLENNLAVGVFTPKRMAVLNVLAAQAAMSLENGRLYRELQQRESKIRRLVDANVVVGVLISDLEGRILEANDAFLAMVRHARVDVASGRLNWSVLTPPEWRQASERAVLQIRATGACEAFEKEYYRSDGTRVPVLVAAAAIEGTPTESVAFVVDLTERKRADEERERLRQAQADLARINRVTMMGELAASLAHEIKQPIAAAITNANACLRWLSRSPPNLMEARANAARLVKDATRASEIITRVRSLYKKDTPHRELVDVNGPIRETVELLRSEASRFSVSMRTDLASDLPCVSGDRVQLQQLLMNLILNGIEAMKDAGGTLSVESRCGARGEVLIKVSDEGSGLPEGKAEEIFEAFFTTKPQGTGMGLAISRSIVETHGGRVWATPGIERGACFNVSLPAVESVSKEPAARA